jgi:hypothetical protein
MTVAVRQRDWVAGAAAWPKPAWFNRGKGTKNGQYYANCDHRVGPSVRRGWRIFLEPWTELSVVCQKYGAHWAVAWIGHTPEGMSAQRRPLCRPYFPSGGWGTSLVLVIVRLPEGRI